MTYDSTYAPDVYNVAVKVLSKKFLFGTAVTKFRLTKFLSGDIVLSQGGVIRKKYISNDMPVNHTIVLKNSFLEFIRKTKNFIKLFWFVDCVYYGVRSDFEFDFNYTKVDSMHYVEALLVAAYNPNLTKEYILPSVEKSGLKNLTGLKEIPKITPILPNLNSSKSNETDFDGVDEELKNWIINLNATKKFNASDSKNYCINSSVVPINPDNSYGFFRTNLVVKCKSYFSLFFIYYLKICPIFMFIHYSNCFKIFSLLKNLILFLYHLK